MDAKLREELRTEIGGIKTLQAELSKLFSNRVQLNAQKKENEVVLEEFNLLDDDANVFKMVGVTLVKQDLVEAKSNVEKRIEYINGEISRIENQVKNTESKLREKEAKITKLQQKVQAAAQAAAVPAQ
uniref:Prefoldin subunit 6 n=1 Tax=Polytomella parva TaxID=51329 RepID=A0A7S0YAF3_9CHLO|mmetsp:Transcript_17921/g.32715  ORF Transcript_17921/g.32715 Transcript_17921/m.32715 type:complete len:128 (+) Transcript_17921:79-462(+)|eukprot:CAMPEP_0175048132 /NCGR_PEP_ID=MMETSP0052_2-20121109/5998_1 /TAXON_ID=51329 ORGANISM="Polytomella parva, Strain SAG 63-3" /NCGR_SAMPLE_ID=MMETSP0052_2 /ASSEMBLY_ACC=CAM_ASM_000194 /LENGTH=127 /DNA_ID=CAMNT_0016312119 /DNA_START=71 /DNA_END=454 /DNA_ORIENTATION=-